MRDRYAAPSSLSLLFMFLLLVVSTSELLSPPAVRGNSASGQASQQGPAGEETTAKPAVTYPTDVVTYHYDNSRTGAMVHEQILTLSNVKSLTFGKIGFFPTDGKVDAEPLYLTSVFIHGVTHNVLYVVTEHASAYAFDADTGAQLWKVSALAPGKSPATTMGADRSHRRSVLLTLRSSIAAWDQMAQSTSWPCRRIRQGTTISDFTRVMSRPAPSCSEVQPRLEPSIRERATAARAVT